MFSKVRASLRRSVGGRLLSVFACSVKLGGCGRRSEVDRPALDGRVTTLASVACPVPRKENAGPISTVPAL